MSEFWWHRSQEPYYPPEMMAMSGGSDDGLVDVCFVRNQWRWCAIPADETVEGEFRGTAADQAAAIKAAEDFITAWPTLTERQKARIVSDRDYELECGEDDGD